MLLKKGDRRGQRLRGDAMADAFLPDAGQPGCKVALPERLLKTEGLFRRHHVVGIAMPEQQRPPGERRQLMADIPFAEAVAIKARRGKQGLRQRTKIA